MTKQNQTQMRVEKLKGRVVTIESPSAVVRIFVAKRGNVDDVFVRRIGGVIEDSYAEVEDVYFDIGCEEAKAVYWSLILATASGRKISTEEVDVYYGEYGGLRLYYFERHLVYAVKDGEVYDLGRPSDGVVYAADYFEEEELEAVKQFIEALGYVHSH